jgi:hypothetical protein
MNKPLLAAAIAAAMTASAAHATTVAIAGDGSWNEFNVDSFVAQDFGTGWIDSADGSALDFTFTIAAGQHGTLSVVDAGFAGDTFTITSNGSVLGNTAAVPAGDVNGPLEFDFDAALGNASYSHGTFTLGAGSYSISGSLLQSVLDVDGGPLDATNGALRLSVSAVPEPASAALVFAGVAALGLVARRRKATRSTDAI